ncbi:MAG: hypothetical protein HUU55_22230 [Myxococcales bacterium]|nr:hypothetical protein [Myxococcales bacterium]
MKGATTYRTGRDRANVRIYDQLNRLYARLPADLPADVEQLRAAGRTAAGGDLAQHPMWNLDGDLAWLLLHQTVRLSAGQDETYLRLYWELVPPLGAWLTYLTIFPEGDFCRDYRERRVRKAERWLMQTHLPRAWRDDPKSAPPWAQKHVAGELVCLACRAAMTRGATATNADPAAGRLRASTTDDSVEVSTVVGYGQEVAYAVTTLTDDNNYMRCWIQPEGNPAFFPANLRIIVGFGDQGNLAADFHTHLELSGGVNLGKLGQRRLQDIDVVFVRTIMDTREADHGTGTD